MYFWILALAGATLLFGADEARLELTIKAQSAFDRVQMAAVPQLRDAAECVQSQAALAAVATAQDAALVHYRKGYCSLALGVITFGAGEFTSAAGEFARALENWPAHARAMAVAKNAPPAEPAAWRVLESITILQAAANRPPVQPPPPPKTPPDPADGEGESGAAATARPAAKPEPAGIDRALLDKERAVLATVLANATCAESSMPDGVCRSVLNAGRRWLGWIALDRDNLETAAREFSSANATGWWAWVAARRAVSSERFAEAAGEYQQAIEAWTAETRQPAAALADRLGPAHDLGSAYTELGGAQVAADKPQAAIASLDESIRRDPSNARAIYLRAVARRNSGEKEQALADFSLASRTAFANAKDLASGEAHLYRGMLLYERKDYPRAEEEFASALNFEIPKVLAGDASAWRHMAAVKGGACGSSDFLARSLVRVSPHFPKDEALAAMASCRRRGTSQTTAADTMR